MYNHHAAEPYSSEPARAGDTVVLVSIMTKTTAKLTSMAKPVQLQDRQQDRGLDNESKVFGECYSIIQMMGL